MLNLKNVINIEIYCGQLSTLRRIANKMLLPFRNGTGVVFFSNCQYYMELKTK